MSSVQNHGSLLLSILVNISQIKLSRQAEIQLAGGQGVLVTFGITDYRCVLSLRDPEDKVKYHDDDEMWNNAEDALRKVLNDLGIEYTEVAGRQKSSWQVDRVYSLPTAGFTLTSSFGP